MIGVMLVVALWIEPEVARGSAANPPVSLELKAEPGFPMTSQHRWMKFLEDFGFSDIRIRGANPGDEATVINRGTDQTPRYRVVGILTGGGVLQLPGAALRYGQRPALQQWLERLRQGGTDSVTQATGVFGLTESQLLKVHSALRDPVTTSTKGRAVRDVVQQMVTGLKVAVQIDTPAETAMRGGGKVRDELRGISRGTALVAAIRPLGLDLVAALHNGGQVALRIVRSGQNTERWPLGWKPKKSPAQSAPALFKFVPVEIVDTPLNDALDAIQQRTEVPILFDHNGLAKHEVDLAQKVALPQTKTFYKKIIDKLLFQAKLQADLRVDEAGHPLLWVTTLGR